MRNSVKRNAVRVVLCLFMVATFFLTGCQAAVSGTQSVVGSATLEGHGAEGNAASSTSSASGGDSAGTNATSQNTDKTVVVEEFYDDQFVSYPEISATSKAPKRTMQNVSNYNFNEQEYKNFPFKGGSETRAETFIRGIGGNQLNKTGGYGNLTAWETATDKSYFQDLNVTSKRSWDTGYTQEKLEQSDFTHATGSGFSSFIDHTIHATGAQGGSMYRFGGVNAIQQAIKGIQKYQVERLTTAKNLVCALLGNEFLYIGIDPSTGSYSRGGYDTDTLTQWRKWLKERYKTVANLNRKCSVQYTTFAEAWPDDSTYLKNEHFLFSRKAFYEAGKAAVEYSKSKNPNIRYGYASYCSYGCAYGNDAYLDFLDYNTSNLYKQAWWDSMPSPYATFAYQLDNLASVSDKPVLLTELGFTNGFTAESEAAAAREYLQSLALCYMRPRVGGTYVFEFMSHHEEGQVYSTWGIVRAADRSTTKAFDALKQIYTDFKNMDYIYNNASSTPQVALTNRFVDRQTIGIGSSGGAADANTSVIAQVCYTNGIGVRALLGDGADDVKNLDVDKVILTDHLLWQNPDGSDDVATALVDFMDNGGKILRMNEVVPSPMFEEGNALKAKTMEELAAKHKNLVYDPQKTSSTSDYANVWKSVAPFVHGDFVAGKVKTEAQTVNESAVRVLEVKAKSDSLFVAADPTWQIQTQMVYNNGKMYLCVVNVGQEVIDDITVTLGINDGVTMNLHPQVICADGNVAISSPARASYPSWIEDASESAIQYGEFKINNLNTYAFIEVGMAVVE